MTNPQIEISDIHWLMDILQNIDVGLLVLDRNYDVQLWSAFMEGHSGISPQHAKGKNLFGMFPELPEAWFRQKAEPVFQLKTRTFTIWEQRPYLFRFSNSRPITGRSEFMYQNTSIIPLESVTRQADHICVIIYDVTDTAVSKSDTSKALESIEAMKSHDALTGLLSKEAWLPVLDSFIQRAGKGETNGSLLLLDMDHFRDLNGQLGHAQGDEILKRIAQGLQNLSGEQNCARLGGEIFGVLLENEDADAAVTTAERLRRSVSALGKGRANVPPISASIGVATWSKEICDAAHWLNCTDKALYHAKESGRNQTSLYQASGPAS